MTTGSSVAIGVATYLRPKYMELLLGSLSNLELCGAKVQLIVVDNDPAGSANKVVMSWAANCPAFTVHYEIEPSRGIPAARNRIVAIARQTRQEYLAFVDDDEVVDSQWLKELVDTATRTSADVVSGRIVQVLEHEKSRWLTELMTIPMTVSAGKSLDLGCGMLVTTIVSFSTGNVLIRVSCLEGMPEPFDVRLALAGGSDHLLATRLNRKCFLMLHCDSAKVTEYIPESRATYNWWLRRQFRLGVSQGTAVRLGNPTALGYSSRISKSLGLIAVSLVAFVPSITRGRVVALRCIGEAARGIGGLAGLVGLMYREYQTIHGN